MENFVVYIPKEACVKNMPLQSLSSSTARKISVALFPHGSEKQVPQTVTRICPVELREKEVAVGKDRREPVPLSQRELVSKITPGQFSLPVVSSSKTAFKALRRILKEHKPEIQFSGLDSEAASLPSIRNSDVRRNAIILYNGQIFLSVRRVRLQNSPSAPPAVCPVSPSQQNQINTSRCQAQALLETSPRPQQSKSQDVQTPVRDLDINTLLNKVSEEMPEQCCTDKECQKEEETASESRSRSSDPKSPEGLESGQETSSSLPSIFQPSQINHTSSGISEQPEEAAGGQRETSEDDNERSEGALLPRAESCLAFDFEQLAQEERINHLRAQLRQKEAALSIFHLKPTDQI
ncbi:hypothetical protein cypCar_00024256 [Cyprinus carpio]|uniref:Uncharacterized protein LOC109063596 n=1 Tax=Cyprinus carpio TaxID=7962 RepID=A0A9Q9YCP6_CYPCA|nr:uncharacterized protein LOC109063596 [Cyprinus carpio]XP_042617792.1 uncharacterized protein LOC109063596 [Cyprinus carpio]KTF81391.1 hypothetical protein cypCar_00024256 [Cyprinus carpio]